MIDIITCIKLSQSKLLICLIYIKKMGISDTQRDFLSNVIDNG